MSGRAPKSASARPSPSVPGSQPTSSASIFSRVAGGRTSLERPADGPVMRCSHCDAELGTSEARGIGTTPVILALVIGIIAGCGVLWLDHAGLIALWNLDSSRLLVTVKAGVRDWWVSLEQLRWRDWYNPPSE